MKVRAILFSFALAAKHAIRDWRRAGAPKAVIHVLDGVPVPPCFYIRIDDRVFAVELKNPR